jgi:hypothetical protein
MTTEEKLIILRHALGLNPDGAGTSYRAHYYVSYPLTEQWQKCSTLTHDGLMYSADGRTFLVTDAGRAFVAEHSPAAKRAAILDRIAGLDDETLFTLADCFLEVA